MKFFEADDIGPCSALDGTKKLVIRCFFLFLFSSPFASLFTNILLLQVVFYKNYYVVVTEEQKDILAERNTVTVYDWRDRRNKFIAFQMQVSSVHELFEK